jgi:signal transduction histidine kinase
VLLASTIDGVRRLSKNLRPAALEDLGLAAALHSHAATWHDLGLDVALDIKGQPTRLSRTIEYAVYRVAQEALSNAARHAQASQASLELTFSNEDLTLCVLDHGTGFLASSTRPGQGLLGMRDRAAEIGADLTIDSQPGQGTRVRLWVPLALTLLEGR